MGTYVYYLFLEFIKSGRIHSTAQDCSPLWLAYEAGYKAGLAKSPEPGLHDVLRELRAERDRLIEKTTPEAERSTFFPQ